MKNAHSFYIVFQALRVVLKEICKIQPPNRLFQFVFFILTFISADIIFHKFLELYLTLSEKNIFATNFSLLTDSLNSIFYQSFNFSLIDSPSKAVKNVFYFI